MGHSKNKPSQTLQLRNREEIINLLGEYEGSRQNTSLVNFCKDHQVSPGPCIPGKGTSGKGINNHPPSKIQHHLPNQWKKNQDQDSLENNRKQSRESLR